MGGLLQIFFLLENCLFQGSIFLLELSEIGQPLIPLGSSFLFLSLEALEGGFMLDY